MIEEVATVVRLVPEGVAVECFSRSACGQCRQSQHCGTGLIAKALSGRSHQFVIATPLSLRVGEQVRIGIPEQSLIKSALLIYLLPLLCVLVASLLASVLFRQGDGGTIASAIVGGWLGFLLASRLARRTGVGQAGPVILGPPIPVSNID
ncbi:SoxR reducing system RseC family protein [Zobellella maritima]|uniref:SoxR reducing system RseC family protein n=1 Tax=Zobellella maritima TaxID=2059725 RepID=UPI000E305EC5|nr:SoxR reducing system RseC family protein [Zobellella maritima]